MKKLAFVIALAFVALTLSGFVYQQQVTMLTLPAGTNHLGSVSIDTGGQTLAPTVSATAASSLVLKSSAGGLYDAYAVSTTAGFLMVFDAASAPADGTVTPKHCVPVNTANGIAALSFGDGPAEAYTTGIVAVFSTGANCFTKTASATAFLHGRAL